MYTLKAWLQIIINNPLFLRGKKKGTIHWLNRDTWGKLSHWECAIKHHISVSARCKLWQMWKQTMILRKLLTKYKPSSSITVCMTSRNSKRQTNSVVAASAWGEGLTALVILLCLALPVREVLVCGTVRAAVWNISGIYFCSTLSPYVCNNYPHLEAWGLVCTLRRYFVVWACVVVSFWSAQNPRLCRLNVACVIFTESVG